MVPVLFTATTLTFFLIRLAPGGPFTEERNFPAESIRRLHEHYGLDDPILAQYVRYLGNVLRGDLGPSFKYTNRTVNQIIAETFPVSLELGLCGLCFAPNSALDHFSMGLAMAGICVPSFVLGPLLVLAFALGLRCFNAAGWETLGDRVLPSVALGAAYAAYIARLTRGSMLEILPRDYVRTARAKGLSEPRVLTVHVLRNALPPVVSFLGPAVAGLLTGSFVVETVFYIPGMGKAFVAAAFNRDYSLILGLVVFYAGLIVVCNTLADILLAWLDPRLRLEA
jgi:oligopeptide transport system permease protein